MSSRYQSREAHDTMDIDELSDAEEICTIGDEENSQAKDNNLRLTQAISYLADEGGDDSPLTYMTRVDRIHEALVQKLPRHNHNYDKKLWSKVRAMVLAVRQDFAHTAEQIEPPMAESEYRVPESTLHDVEVLDRVHELPELPKRPTKRTPSQPGKFSPSLPPPDPRQDNVERERGFTYGGPNSEPECWYRDMPASLPFPETFRMAHWESLKIDYDLSKSSKKLSLDGKAVETDVSFHHDALKQYDSLPYYESGSRFKLPHTTSSDYAAIRSMASAAELRKSVKYFNLGNRTEQERKNYVPRLFFPQFGIGKQASPRDSLPSAIRKSLSTTPTRPPRSDAPGVSGSLSATSANARIQAMQDELESLQKSIKRARKSGVDSDTNAPDEPETSTPKRRKTNTTPAASFESSSRAGPAMRKFATQRAEALRSSPQRESQAKGSPDSPGAMALPPLPPTPSRNKEQFPSVATLAHVAIPTKRPVGRPRKSSLPLPEASSSTTTAPYESSPKHVQAQAQAITLTPRKHSLGGNPYTPDSKRVRMSPAAAKPVRSARKSDVRTTPKRVEFMDVPSASDGSDEFIYVSSESDGSDDDGNDGDGDVEDIEVETVARPRGTTTPSKAALAGRASRGDNTMGEKEREG